jgi:hypothetical protein
MYVHCDKCGYDSGDEDSNVELSKKVLEDGGLMFNTQQGFGQLSRNLGKSTETCR